MEPVLRLEPASMILSSRVAWIRLTPSWRECGRTCWEAGLVFNEAKFYVYSPAGAYEPGPDGVCANYGRKPAYLRVAKKEVKDPRVMLEILRAEVLGEISHGQAEARRVRAGTVSVEGVTIWGAPVSADDRFYQHHLLEDVTACLQATLNNVIPTLGAEADVLQHVIGSLRLHSGLWRLRLAALRGWRVWGCQ